jgi:hypothetical protein
VPRTCLALVVIPRFACPFVVIPQRSGGICFSRLRAQPDGVQNGKPQNNLRKRGVFFTAGKSASFPPHSPHITPRFHHQNTTSRHPLFPKHLKNTNKKAKPWLSPGLNFFPQKYPKTIARQTVPEPAPQATVRPAP